MSKQRNPLASPTELQIVRVKFAVENAREEGFIPDYDAGNLQALIYKAHNLYRKEYEENARKDHLINQLKIALEFMRAHYCPKKLTSEIQAFERNVSDLIR